MTQNILLRGGVASQPLAVNDARENPQWAWIAMTTSCPDLLNAASRANGSNAQGAGFAKWRIVVALRNMTGPNLPFTDSVEVALQRSHFGHSRMVQHFQLAVVSSADFDTHRLVGNFECCQSETDTGKTDSAMQIDEERDTRKAIFRGLRLRCPSCGEGGILYRYLKVKDKCGCCGQELHHASVDDGPAYFTLLVVVAIIFPMFAVIYSLFEPEPLLVALSTMALATVLALFILPRVKGLFIGLQWSKKLHGF
jgi:uncharacterized protein (DUF983 family)